MNSRIAVINLSTNKIEKLELERPVIRDYIGGRGLGAYLLYKYFKKGTDAMHPDNVIIYSIGPLQGTKTFYSSKCVLTTKSPLTNRILFSLASGELGHEIARTGFVAVVIIGKAEKPSYIRIENDDVRICSAEKIWGTDTIIGQARLLEDAGFEKGSALCIGPSGEQLIRISIVMTGGETARSFGRGGCGAVMGSKNLKGIAFKGTGKTEPAFPDVAKENQKKIMDNIKKYNNWAVRWRSGTGGDCENMSEQGLLPTRNWQSGSFEDAGKISYTDADERLWTRKNIGCGPYCPTPCAHIGEITSGRWKGAKTRGPEYETVYAFGPNCGISAVDTIVAAEDICDVYGLDTMSAGCTIAYAMESYERGYITKEDTGGIDLHFGNEEAVVELTRQIAFGEGFGKLLGEGTRIVSKHFGSEDFAMHCKGLEFGGYECRGLNGQALAFSLASRGGCHHAFGLPARSPSDMNEGSKIEGKGMLVRNGASSRIVFDSAAICAFPQLVLSGLLLDFMNGALEFGYTQEQLSRVGHRVATLERLFNLNEGGGRDDDYLPKRLREEPKPEGTTKGTTVPMDALLDEGYKSFGWDIKNGVPTEETIKLLGLEWTAE